jgi:plastocyanin domain-containing protein
MRAAFLCLALLLSCRETAKPPPVQAASGGPPVKEVAVTLKGFEPARIEVAGGQPVVLRFTRKVEDTCADAVDVQGDPVRHMLPLGRPVDIRVTAPPSGEVAFACPMKMYRGVVIVAGH